MNKKLFTPHTIHNMTLITRFVVAFYNRQKANPFKGEAYVKACEDVDDLEQFFLHPTEQTYKTPVEYILKTTEYDITKYMHCPAMAYKVEFDVVSMKISAITDAIRLFGKQMYEGGKSKHKKKFNYPTVDEFIRMSKDRGYMNSVNLIKNLVYPMKHDTVNFRRNSTRITKESTASARACSPMINIMVSGCIYENYEDFRSYLSITGKMYPDADKRYDLMINDWYMYCMEYAKRAQIGDRLKSNVKLSTKDVEFYNSCRVLNSIRKRGYSSVEISGDIVENGLDVDWFFHKNVILKESTKSVINLLFMHSVDTNTGRFISDLKYLLVDKETSRFSEELSVYIDGLYNNGSLQLIEREPSNYKIEMDLALKLTKLSTSNISNSVDQVLMKMNGVHISPPELSYPTVVIVSMINRSRTQVLSAAVEPMFVYFAENGIFRTLQKLKNPTNFIISDAHELSEDVLLTFLKCVENSTASGCFKYHSFYMCGRINVMPFISRGKHATGSPFNDLLRLKHRDEANYSSKFKKSSMDSDLKIHSFKTMPASLKKAININSYGSIDEFSKSPIAADIKRSFTWQDPAASNVSILCTDRISVAEDLTVRLQLHPNNILSKMVFTSRYFPREPSKTVIVFVSNPSHNHLLSIAMESLHDYTILNNGAISPPTLVIIRSTSNGSTAGKEKASLYYRRKENSLFYYYMSNSLVKHRDQKENILYNSDNCLYIKKSFT